MKKIIVLAMMIMLLTTLITVKGETHMLKKKLTTLIHIVLDESGSMQSCLDGTIKGYNEYLATLKKNDSDRALLTLTKFNTSSINTLYDAIDVKEIPGISSENYKPDNGTPLYDAMGKAIKIAEKQLHISGDDTRVLFIILSDGEENASREYTKEKVFATINEKKGTDKWTFVFLGANQDAYMTGDGLGMSHGNTTNYNTKDMGVTFKGLSNSTDFYRNSINCVSETFFKPEDKITIEQSTK